MQISTKLPLTPEYIAKHYLPDTPETKAPLAISLAFLTQSAEIPAVRAANVGGKLQTA